MQAVLRDAGLLVGPIRAPSGRGALARRVAALGDVMKHKFGLMATGAVLFLTLSTTSSGKSVPARTRPQSSGLSAQAELQTKQPSQEFQGTIERIQAKYVLEDKASGARYQLSNQDKAKQFVDKDVKITGTLDPSTNTIDVSAIEEME